MQRCNEIKIQFPHLGPPKDRRVYYLRQGVSISSPYTHGLFFLEPTWLILSECCGYWEFCCLFFLKYAWLMGNGSCLSILSFSRQSTELKKGTHFLGIYWEQGQITRESWKLWISILHCSWIILSLMWQIEYDLSSAKQPSKIYIFSLYAVNWVEFLEKPRNFLHGTC